MPAPYPMELRERVVAAYNNKEGGYAELAARFSVGEATVNRWVNRARREGGVAVPRPMGGARNQRVLPEHHAFLLETLKTVPDSTLKELQQGLRETFGLKVSIRTVHYTLRKKLGMTRKRGA